MKTFTVFYLSFVFSSITVLATAQPNKGEQAPEIALPNTRGEIEKLSDQKGKVVLIDFWASWCGPCRQSNPKLVKLYNEYKTKGFEIFGVSIDENKADWKKAISKDKITWKQVNGKGGWDSPVALSWKIEQIPTSYLLDKNGKLVGHDLNAKELEQKINELLNQ